MYKIQSKCQAATWISMNVSRGNQPIARCVINCLKSDEAVFSSEGQREEVTDEEKLNIHLAASFKRSRQLQEGWVCCMDVTYMGLVNNLPGQRGNNL